MEKVIDVSYFQKDLNYLPTDTTTQDGTTEVTDNE